MSTEKMLHWSDKLLFAKELYARWSLMESARENLVKLINILSNPVDSASSERASAAERIQGMLDENSDPDLADGLIDCAQKEMDVTVLLRLVPALQEMKSLAVPVLTDILLAIGVAIYESPEAKTFQATDESNRLRCAAARSLGIIGDKRSVVA